MGGTREKSKKPSATKSWRPKPGRVYFLDENLGGVLIAEALGAKGVKVELHRDHFPPGTEDIEWLGAVASRGWVVLTRDQKIRTRTNELEVVRITGARMVVLTGGNMAGPELAATLASRIKGIDTALDAHPSVQIMSVSTAGKISDITPKGGK